MKRIHRWMAGLALLGGLASAQAASSLVSQKDNLCLEAAGNVVKMARCDATKPAQGFEFSAGGTIAVDGRCLTVMSLPYGQLVVLSNCTGVAEQIWKRDGDFVTFTKSYPNTSVTTQFCLTESPAQWLADNRRPVNPTNYAEVLLSTCAHDADRKWTFSDLPPTWPADPGGRASSVVPGAALSPQTLKATVNWIYSETQLSKLPFCWKGGAYDRGIGIAPGCSEGKQNIAGLCYDPPRNGYNCTGLVCSKPCPSGYSSSGPLTCSYTGSSKTYTKEPKPQKFGGGCVKSRFRCAALCYDREDDRSHCRSGYAMDVCGICSYQGAWDVYRDSYTRVGELPSACHSNRTLQDGMCYLKPRENYACAATMCNHVCAPGTTSCGESACARDAGTCASTIVDMTISSAVLLANLSGSPALGVITGKVKTAVGKVKERVEQGAAAGELASILHDSLSEYMNAAEGNLAAIASDKVEQQVRAKYGYMTPNYRLIAREYAAVQILAAVSDTVREVGVLALTQMDPTGLVATVDAFLKPECKQSKPIPS